MAGEAMWGWLVAFLEALALIGVYTVLRALHREYHRLQERYDAAHDRLYAAWKDGYAIPPQEPAPMPPPEALLPELQKLIDDWEGADAQGAQEKIIRQMMAQGMSQPDIAKALLS